MKFLKRLSIKRYYKYKDEVVIRNDIASQTFLMVGTIVAIVNLLSNVFIRKTNGYFQSIILVVYFLVAFVIRNYFIKNHIKRSTLFLYLIQLPVLVFGALMGTVWDPNSITITFFLLIVTLPAFILDNPVRHLSYIIGIMAMYLVLGYFTKNPEVFDLDLVHALSFFMGSMFLNLFVLAERYDNIENYVLSERRARHDEITGLKNRYALRVDSEKFVGKSIIVGLVDIDYFKFFNDIYGHDFGEDMMTHLGKMVGREFGIENCYRFESDKIMVINESCSGDEFKEKVQKVKDSFGDSIIKDKHIHPNCTVVYMSGTPESMDDMSEFQRHADVRLLELKNNGRGQIASYEYDRSLKRQTDILSEVSINPSAHSLDEVTGLPNMHFFRIRVDEILNNLVEYDKKPVVLYFNISNFRSYNEMYGFRKGDKLLKDIAVILQEAFPGRLVSRFSEDHFVTMVYEFRFDEAYEDIMNRVKPLFGNAKMDLKVGIAYCTEGEYVGATCDKAKLACDSIKHDYEVTRAYYDEELEGRNKLEQYVISHVDEAVENEYLKVYYQPVIDISTGKIIELEALARWIDPIHGFLSPGDFIPVLENSKLIHKVDKFIARKVCLDQNRLRDMAGRDVPVSINLSRLDFMLTDIVSFIKKEVEDNKVELKNLHIEVTESALEKDSEELKQKINELKSFGFEIWMDDFGSGYSSLNSLQDFSFDVVKVDMKFMRTLDSNDQTPTIVKSIIEMIRNLGLRSLVEGVETEKQLEFIKDAKVNMAQGFLFSKPVPLEDLKFSA